MPLKEGKPFCFVAMPFGSGVEYGGSKEESDFILNDIIRPAVQMAVEEYSREYPDYQLDVIRELEDSKPGDITDNIIRHLADAHVVIVDLTGKNPNVFLELGVRFALKRNGTILLTQDTETIPFNIRTYRAVEYSPHFHGVAKARTDLKEAILRVLNILGAPNESVTDTDSVVYHALQDLEMSRMGNQTPLSRLISWDTYWFRVHEICDRLNDLETNGIYSPQLLLGISNGGLLLADSVLRLVYRNQLPLVCLWANRSQEPFFENEVNNNLITKDFFESIIANTKSASGRMEVLLMDDIVGSQRTFNQLIAYLKGRLGDLFDKIELRFVFLYTTREERRKDLKQYLLHNHAAVSKRNRKPFEEVTQRTELPYQKNIQYGDIIQDKQNDDESYKD